MSEQFLSEAGTAAANDPRLVSPKKSSALLAVIAEWLAFAAVIVVPFMFLTATDQTLDLPKQVALLGLVSLSVLAWIGSMLIGRVFSLRRTVANPLVLLLVASVLISALASAAKYVGLVGDGGQEYQSFLTTALFAAFFYVVVNVPDKRPLAMRTLLAVSVVGGLVSLYGLLQFGGVNIIPGVTANSFNLVGSTVVLGLYAAVTLVIAASSFFVEFPGKLELVKRIVFGVAGALALAVCIIIDFWLVWTAVIVGLIFVLICAVIRPQAVRRLSWLGVPMAVLIVSVLLLFMNLPLPLRAPAEVFPSFGQSFSVARDSLFSHPIFGSGPGTFASDFALHRGANLNKSALWYVQFDRGQSYLTTVTAVLGLFGLVVWLAIIIVGLWKSIAFLVTARRKDEMHWVLTLALTAAWLASAAGLVLYGVSLASLFLFWILFSLLIRAVSPAAVEIKFEASPRAALSLTFALVVLVVLVLSGWFVSGTRLYADAAFKNASGKDAGTQIGAIITDLENAAKMNPQSATIARNLSAAYLLRIQQALNDSKLDDTARSQQVKDYTSAAIQAGRAATMLGTKDPQNWSQLGATYEAIIPYVSNAPDEAITAFTTATELDPFSPMPLTGLGRIYLAQASRAASDLTSAKDETAKTAAQKVFDEALVKAVDELNKALALKSDYAPAGYQLALALDAQGKTKDAITKLQAVEISNPSDSGVAFEMGVLYYRDGQKDKAQAELQRAIAITPIYANAHWLLATIYEEQQKWDDAIAEIQAVLKNSPDNEMVKKRLTELQNAKAGIAPAPTPESTTSPTTPPSAPLPNPPVKK